MATKSEESLRAFVEEEEPVPAAQPAPATLAPAVLPALIPPAPSGSTGAKKTGATGKSAKTPSAPKKAAGRSAVGANSQKNAQAAEQATTAIQQSLTDAAGRLTDRIASWDTPGGIGLMLLALFILLWMIVPVNGGHTRFGLLWLTLTGQTYLPDDNIPGTGTNPTPGPNGCPPGYIPDGKGGCLKAQIVPQGFPLTPGTFIPFVGSAFPDLSGGNGFNPGQFIGV